ncbi:MAG: sodium:alanine symporter family protein [Oscillospiraceae bacterium]|nr:sodium:alanine symporter family protein [Oscillospiraceae bacterium]
MEQILRFNEFVGGIVWGIPAMVLIFGTGVLLSIRCGFPQFARFGRMLRCALGSVRRRERDSEELSPFKAMCTALAAAIGTGNIAGVSGAIALGGPGAVFWMWVSALVGMGTKFAEVTLAVHYRERNAEGDWVGGPMYYIRNGLGRRWNWLGALFCLFGALSAFGIGNMTQINTIAGTVTEVVAGFAAVGEYERMVIELIVGVICSSVIFFVLFGGVSHIGDVCAMLVPLMAGVYTLASLAVIALHAHEIPGAFRAIVVGAFDPGAVAGGMAGIGIREAVTRGVGRGIFSNEAGLGSAPIAHAAANVKHPAEQGVYGMFEVFLDTIVICTMTALVILLGVGVENIPYGTDAGALLAINAFRSVFDGAAAGMVVAVCMTLFAIASVLAWGLYGARCCEYLLGGSAAKLYQLAFALCAIAGATMELEDVWAIADTLNGLMALPNLVALLALSPVAAKLSREYFSGSRAKKKDAGKR